MWIIYDVDIIFHTVCVLCLVAGAWVVKKFIKKFPYELIPILLVVMSVVITAIYFNKFQDATAFNMRLSDGLANGLAAIGVHQIYKQTQRYILMRKIKKSLKNDKRKKARIIS